VIKDDLSSLVEKGIKGAVQAGVLPELHTPEIEIERPNRSDYGDYATNIALKLKRVGGGLSSIRIAEAIKQYIPSQNYISGVEVISPGFLNFRLSQDWLFAQVETILKSGSDYGKINLGNGEAVQVEFVSANPTGALHIGSGRGAAIGDALANVLQAAGYSVQREYYINDAGSRMAVWNESLYAAYLQELGRPAQFPPDGYHAESYAKAIIAKDGDKYLKLPRELALVEIGNVGLKMVIEEAKADLNALGVKYDNWFSEQSLFESGEVEATLQKLRENGHVSEREGAIWFVSSALGQEKDNVLIRSNGQPTYFITDIAYHYNKFVKRGFKKVINIWGADHQGHIPRMRASLMAVGLNPDDLTIIVMQMVSVQGEKMSKRRGNLVRMRELIELVGADAVRFILLSRSPEAQMDFDVDLALKQSNENPVYYVQYAHARITSLFRRATERGINLNESADLTLLDRPAELGLIRLLTKLPEIVETVARTYEPHHLAYFAQDLAGFFHAYYQDNQIIEDNNLPLTQARLKLMQATKITLANTLQLMGMHAPDEM
jgi:arginyl-tRNA synthetase